MASEIGSIQPNPYLFNIENRKSQKAKLAHEVGAGSKCRKCGDKCTGFQLHFWRNVCLNCRCGKNVHEIEETEEDIGKIVIGKLFERPIRTKEEERAYSYGTDLELTNDSTGKQESFKFDWVPPGVGPSVAKRYMELLPPDKRPIAGSQAAKERRRLLEQQLPLYDVDESERCEALPPSEHGHFLKFLDEIRNRVAGQASVQPIEPPKVSPKRAGLSPRLQNKLSNSGSHPISENLVSNTGVDPGNSVHIISYPNSLSASNRANNLIESPPHVSKQESVSSKYFPGQINNAVTSDSIKSDMCSSSGQRYVSPIFASTDSKHRQMNYQNSAFSNVPKGWLKPSAEPGLPNIDNQITDRIEGLTDSTHQSLDSTSDKFQNLSIPGKNGSNCCYSQTPPICHMKSQTKSPPSLADKQVATSLRATEMPKPVSQPVVVARESKASVLQLASPQPFMAVSEDMPRQKEQFSNRLSDSRPPNCKNSYSGFSEDYHLSEPNMVTSPSVSPKKGAEAACPLLCQYCENGLRSGDVAVVCDRAGSDKYWHPQCFVCVTCKELLADLIYFYKDGQVFCGRHYTQAADIPRCKACDELIFGESWTRADGHDWHIHHFCCFVCDQPLAGQKYIPDERDYPHCLSCHMAFKAKMCESCENKISPEEARASYNGYFFHGRPQCFRCYACRRSLVGNKFKMVKNWLFCSQKCVQDSETDIALNYNPVSKTA